MKKILLFTTIFAAILSLGFAKSTAKKSIAVFVPGIIDDSPTYNMLVQGVKAAVERRGKGDFGLDKVKELDAERRATLAEAEALKLHRL